MWMVLMGGSFDNKGMYVIISSKPNTERKCCNVQSSVKKKRRLSGLWKPLLGLLNYENYLKLQRSPFILLLQSFLTLNFSKTNDYYLTFLFIRGWHFYLLEDVFSI